MGWRHVLEIELTGWFVLFKVYTKCWVHDLTYAMCSIHVSFKKVVLTSFALPGSVVLWPRNLLLKMRSLK